MGFGFPSIGNHLKVFFLNIKINKKGLFFVETRFEIGIFVSLILCFFEGLSSTLSTKCDG